MQQTETYKLNLIETSDPFSPVPLNENTQKLESILSTKTTTLDARVTALEAHKIAVGHYHGNDAPSHTIEVGFTPIAVLIHVTNSSHSMYGAISVLDIGEEHKTSWEFSIVENGFTVFKNSGTHFNHSNYEYNYIALG